MPDPRITWTQDYPGGRIVAQLGQVEAGAVFPPRGTPQDRPPCFWRLWIGGPMAVREGYAKSEQAAKNALAGALADWLRRAGLQSVRDDAT